MLSCGMSSSSGTDWWSPMKHEVKIRWILLALLTLAWAWVLRDFR